MKKALSFIIALVLAAALMACGGSPDSSDNSSASMSDVSSSAAVSSGGQTVERDKFTVAFFIFSMAEEFDTICVDGAEEKAKELGDIDLVVMDPSGDLQKEISIMEDLISQGVDCICIPPIDAQAIIPYIEKAREAGIKVINWDTETKTEVDAKVMSDNFKGGAMDADHLVEKMGTEGKVLILDDLEAVTTSFERIQGFEEEMAKIAPNVEIIKQLSTTTGVRDIHQTTTENMLQAHPDITAIFCCEGGRTLGAYVACEANKRQDVLIVGYDATPEEIQTMKNDGPDSNMIGVVDLQPTVLGAAVVEQAHRILNGEEVEPVRSIDIRYISAQDVADGNY